MNTYPELRFERPHTSSNTALQLESVVWKKSSRSTPFIVGTIWRAKEEGKWIWKNSRSALANQDSFNSREEAKNDILNNVELIQVPVVRELADRVI